MLSSAVVRLTLTTDLVSTIIVLHAIRKYEQTHLPGVVSTSMVIARCHRPMVAPASLRSGGHGCDGLATGARA